MSNEALQQKLHARGWPKLSGKMVAILACILDQRWTQPQLQHLHITDDGWLLAEHAGDCGANHLLGCAEDLDRNLGNILRLAELTPTEEIDFEKAYRQAVTDHRLVPRR